MNPGWQKRSKRQTLRLIHEDHEALAATLGFEVISAFAPLYFKA
jgi:hypothetical protein